MREEFGRKTVLIVGANTVLVFLLCSLAVFNFAQSIFDPRKDTVLAATVVSHPSPGFVEPEVLGAAVVKAQNCVDFFSMNVLVNKDSIIPEDFVPNDLVTLSDWNIPGTAGLELRTEAARHLQTMLFSLKEVGLSLYVNSAYRSYTFQQRLYQQGGPGESGLSIPAPAGESEHELGTAVDFALGNGGKLYPSASWNWLDQNAHRFGFVMSYRFSQQKETGIYFEPWHFRYVGVDLATEIRYSESTPQSFYQKSGCR